MGSNDFEVGHSGIATSQKTTELITAVQAYMKAEQWYCDADPDVEEDQPIQSPSKDSTQLSIARREFRSLVIARAST